MGALAIPVAPAPPAPAPAAQPGATWRPGRSSDEHLAGLVSSGSDAAFAILYQRYHQPLYRYCRSLVRNDADAQDALQSTLVSAFAALQRAQRDAPLRPWLFRIAHNEAISLVRRRRSEDALPELWDRGGQSPHEQVEQREQLSLLVSDLQELSEQQRAAILMRELNGLHYEEIAVALSTSTGSIKRTIFDARRALVDLRDGRATPCDEICRRLSDTDRHQRLSRGVKGHLRDCPSCEAFAYSIRRRRKQLHAMVEPLSATSASGVLGHLLGTGSVSLGAGAGACTGFSAGAASTGGALMTKIASLLVVAAATVAAGTVIRQESPGPRPATDRASVHAAPASAHPSTQAQSSTLAVPTGRQRGPLSAPAFGRRPGASAHAATPGQTATNSTRVPSPPLVPLRPAVGAPSGIGAVHAGATSRSAAAPRAAAVGAEPTPRHAAPTSGAAFSPSGTATSASGGSSGSSYPQDSPQSFSSVAGAGAVGKAGASSGAPSASTSTVAAPPGSPAGPLAPGAQPQPVG